MKNINNNSKEGFVIENNNQDENNEDFYEQSRSSGKIGIHNDEVDKNIKLNFYYGGDLSILNTEEMNQHIKYKKFYHILNDTKILLLSNKREDIYIYNPNKKQTLNHF